MTLVAHGNAANPPTGDPVPNNGFWPDIDPAAVRDAERIDDNITPARLAQALAAAIADINRQLATFQAEQKDAGAQTADDIPTEPWHTADHYPALYRRAINASAHALLLERYRDHSATGDGDERGDAKALAADDYRRDARWAVHEILGRTHTTVELI